MIFLLLFLILGVAYIFITAVASKRYYEETTQRLNADVAKQLLAEAQPFVNGEVNKEALGHIMHSMMAVNPGIEVYLLDPDGKILSFVVLDKKVKLSRISLSPIQEFIKSEGKNYVLGDDPRNPGHHTIFSATEVVQNGQLQGYVYLVLASEKYENISHTLLGSYWLRVGTKSFILTLIAALIIGLILIAYLTKNLRVIIKTVNQFESGDLNARVPEKNTKGELGLLSRNFNKMADTILNNIEELKKTDALRRELIANVSHDLRSPLAVIHGYVETMLIKNEQLDQHERMKYMKIILESSEKLQRLVFDLFELSKLETGQVKVRYEPFFINELLQDASQKYRLLADNKNIKIDANIEKSLPMVYADLSMIDRVIQNLLDNAIKYTPKEGWIQLEVKKEDGLVNVNIENSGKGIPEKDLNSIFNRYFIAEKDKSRTEGTGLGLAIVKKIMDIHQADITVKSVPDRSTRFSFNLPIYNN